MYYGIVVSVIKQNINKFPPLQIKRSMKIFGCLLHWVHSFPIFYITFDGRIHMRMCKCMGGTTSLLLFTISLTRMHSSRMRTACSSSRPGVSTRHPPPGADITHLGADIPRDQAHPPVNRILDTRLWKYYLAQTSFAGGNDDQLGVDCPTGLLLSLRILHVGS